MLLLCMMGARIRSPDFRRRRDAFVGVAIEFCTRREFVSDSVGHEMPLLDAKARGMIDGFPVSDSVGPEMPLLR